MKIRVYFTNGSSYVYTIRADAMGAFLADFAGSPNMERWEIVE